MTSIAGRATRRIASAAEARAAALDLAARWADAGSRRDADRQMPVEELGALAGSGLLAISVPVAFGGAELPPSLVAEVFTILATADIGLAQIAQNHFDFVDVLRFAVDPFRTELFGQVLEGARFGNALAERGVKDITRMSTRLTATARGFTLEGTKHFATGALTADWIPVMALDPDDRVRVAYVERGADGLELLDDWDAFGQRATHSGTVFLRGIDLPAEQVVWRGNGDSALAVALLAGNQLIHTAIEYGGALGSLAARERAGVPATSLMRGEIEMCRLAQARAARLVDAAVQHDSASERAALQAMSAVDAAKTIAYRVGPRAGAAVFGTPARIGTVLLDARADRHWRNSRVHSLHDSARDRARDVAGYLLSGVPPKMAAGLIEDRRPPSSDS